MVSITGKIITTTGTLFIAYAALKVHHRVLEEHKIDDKVFSIMKKEQTLGIIGAILVIVGSILEIYPMLG